MLNIKPLLLSTLLKYYQYKAVPHLIIPGIKPPYFLKFSAVSLGLKVIEV